MVPGQFIPGADSHSRAYGAYGAVGIGVGGAGMYLLLLLMGWRIYQNFRRDRATDQVLEEKEKALQRAASEAREYRIAFFKDKIGWTDEQVERFLVRNQFDDGRSARQALEGHTAEVKK